MKSVDVKITPGARASRAEVIIRIFYGILLAIVAFIFGIINLILAVLNFFTCLLLATRVAPEFIGKFVAWTAMVNSYLYFVTDERPPLFP